MAEVLIRREPSTAIPMPVFNAGVASPPGQRRARSHPRTVDLENDTLLDVLIANRPMLVNLARGFVGCASLAEDVVHDVFIKLVDFPDQDAVRQPLAYVTRMVRNASIDAFRRQSLENTYHADEDDGLHVPSPEPSPEAALLVRDTLRHVYNALEQLPPRSRAAFEMVRLREETLQSTARALDVSQTLVHFMVRDAEKHCADCLDASNRGVAGPVFCGGRARRR
ncbi:RNA polymerase factor sigma-70 [Paraburkholderia sp. RL17-337-BIB-A]|uniref:RNA polymerase factor sigma-70 n=1 Tax=Paraburkholderia sp. RL17-337-BIB-A TaxID=3031636 RepID=UPI0038B74845